MNKVIEIIDSDDDNHTPNEAASISFSSLGNVEPDDNTNSQSRRRRRKSVLHAMTDPDMQFQTIAIEDDDDEVGGDHNTNSTITNIVNTTNTHNAIERAPLKVQKTIPAILAPKPPDNAEIVAAAFEEFLNGPEAKTDLHSIADERVRINYLLSLYGMPEINFSLYTQQERLQFQFEERLKQRKMIQNSRLQDNRRSLLPNNAEKDSIT